MTINEAIEKAGKGGKIRGFFGTVTVYIAKDSQLQRDHPLGDIWCPNANHLLATDWEVVEDKPEIEVGDIVQCKICYGRECQINRIKVKTASLYSISDDLICGCIKDIKNMIKLIRKGPKVITFEGVMIKTYEPTNTVVMTQGNGVCHPIEYLRLANNGKTYDMKLTECDDV